jgi:hypothetical protein
MTRFVEFFMFFMAIQFLAGCAKVGTPIGGPKDVTPPQIVGSRPAINSTQFKGKRIEITFDEFIQLNDIAKYFVVSPPMKKKPVVTTSGKSVVVNLEEPLLPNTTYRFYFGNAIVDLNEKNPLKNFDFVFSTGDKIDSLSFRGRVIDAFDRLPDKENYYVMLYDRFQDSIPRKHLPVYITKTNDKGWFSITHIRPDTFMILALKDLNQNYLFDLPNEPIAFSDSLIRINQNYYIPDSLIKADTTSRDTLNWAPFKSQIQLYSFTENHEKQYLKKYERTTPERFSLIFNTPIMDSLQITPLSFTAKKWIVPDYPILKRDTADYWITDTALMYKDTLRIRLGYTVTDSMEHLVSRFDTISLVYKKPLAAKNKKQLSHVKISSFSMGSNVGTQPTLDLNRQVSLLATVPLLTIDTSKIELVKVQDQKMTKLKFRITHDLHLLRQYFLNFKLEPQTAYQLSMDTMAFTSIYQQVSDSTGFKFQSQKDDYYGKIKLKVTNVKGQMILQLLKDKETIVQQKFIQKDQEVIFDYLEPGKYKIKVIYDRNLNKVWDTGNYAKKIQPEKVLYFIKEIPIRSNWEDEESWELE